MIAIDTHVLVWLATGTRQLISKKAMKRIGEELERGEVWVSTISAWEIAMLVERERLVLSLDVESWLNKINQINAIRFQPVSNKIAIESVRLPGEFHRDPADRLIVATARTMGLALITADEKIQAYPHVNTIW
ncbi:type II toxin-antitoxin system VapC family toxin [Limnobacter parvus]|uniref:Type II toxin-antitoxin system VapC family toxin n=1 Tax=Limnobacter parvus TaxID=2939690 RepID=A0ABT1XJI3_9BURK|nr:type II toxin-antitoxin system VapC family toxin [Limnobacter parvus]MCR2747446.1 type II toxin-antitoxin system VapC family toxin [Limnobacter parvus]